MLSHKNKLYIGTLMVVALGLCVFGLVGTGTANGQATSGTINGYVSDPSGLAVPGAQATLTEVNKGIVLSATTNALGYYTFALISAGTYTLKVEKTGFKTFVRENILLSVDSAVRVDASLEVGSRIEQIVVTGVAPMLKTERADVSSVIQNVYVEEMPILGRNFGYLTMLVPGVIYNYGENGYDLDPTANPQLSLDLNSNGQPNGARNVQLDGVDDNDQFYGLTMVQPDLEEVREVKVTTTNYDAEFGRAGGALTQVETKSGTNGLNGSLFWFLQNNATDARNPFTEPKGASPFKWNQYGGSLGGPIRKNRTFFFGDYQGVTQHTGTPILVTVPLMPWRTGDFSNYRDLNGNLIPVFDPATGDADGVGRQQFPGNIIPPSEFSAAGSKLLSLLPEPTYPDRYTNNYLATGAQTFDTSQASIRIDNYFSQNTRFFGRYIYFGSNLNSPPVYGFGGGPGVFGNGGRDQGRNQNLVLNFNQVFRNNLLLDARYGFSRYRVFAASKDAGSSVVQSIGIPGVISAGLPGISVGATGAFGGFSMGGGPGNDSEEPINEIAGNLTWIKGTHSLKFGGDYTRWSVLADAPGSRRGSFGFSPFVTSAADLPDSGSGVASLLLGDASSFGNAYTLTGGGIGTEHQTHIFLYFQDQWKATSKLTVNYGLRYELYTPYATDPKKGANFDYSTGMVVVNGVGSVSATGNVKTDPNNIAPRLGLAYLLTPKTAIRAAAGRSFYPNSFDVAMSQAWPVYGTYSVSGPTPYSPALNIASGFPPATLPDIPSSGSLRLPEGVSILGFEVNRQSAYVDSWNFSIQRQVTPTLSFNAAYVGNVGRHLRWNYNANVATPGPGPINPRRPLYNKFGYSQEIDVRTNASSSNYNALQLQLEKRFSRDLTFTAAYTWSKTIDFGWFASGGTLASDATNWRNDRGVANRDRAHTLIIGHVYELPFGAKKRFLPNAKGVVKDLVEGWSCTGMTEVISGGAYELTMSSTASLNADWHYLRPDLVGNPKVANPTRELWYNPAAFAQPGPYREGTFGRNVLRGPGYFSANWGLSKEFHPTEKTALQFRVEAFNLFNKTNLSTPDGTVDSPTAGQIFGIVNRMRQMQFGLRLHW